VRPRLCVLANSFRSPTPKPRYHLTYRIYTYEPFASYDVHLSSYPDDTSLYACPLFVVPEWGGAAAT
jgi:hypothetical protein